MPQEEYLIHLNHLIHFKIENETLCAKVFRYRNLKKHFEKTDLICSHIKLNCADSSVKCCKSAFCQETGVVQPFILIQTLNHKSSGKLLLFQLRDLNKIVEVVDFGYDLSCHAQNLKQCNSFVILNIAAFLAIDTISGYVYCINKNNNSPISTDADGKESLSSTTVTNEEYAVICTPFIKCPQGTFITEQTFQFDIETVSFYAAVSESNVKSCPNFNSTSTEQNALKDIEFDIFSFGWINVNICLVKKQFMEMSVTYSNCKIPPVYSNITSALLVVCTENKG